MAQYQRELTADIDSFVAYLDEAMFFKLNRFGEDAFLKQAVQVIEGYSSTSTGAR
jgi:hypothetical protein